MHSIRGIGALMTSTLWVANVGAQTPALPDRVNRFVESELARQQIPGMSVAVLRGDSVLLARGYGFANVERRMAATDSTLYAVGSVTKQFTAAAIVLLSQQGRLQLDDPIIRYLPEGSAVWSGVTIRHLLTHISAIPQDTTLDYQRDYSGWSAPRPLNACNSSPESSRATVAPGTTCSESSSAESPGSSGATSCGTTSSTRSTCARHESTPMP